MLEHIVIMALFALCMGGIPLIIKITKYKRVTEKSPQQQDEEPIKKAV